MDARDALYFASYFLSIAAALLFFRYIGWIHFGSDRDHRDELLERAEEIARQSNLLMETTFGVPSTTATEWIEDYRRIRR